MRLLSNIFEGYFLKFFDECPIDLVSRQEHAASEEKRGNICLKHLLLNLGFFLGGPKKARGAAPLDRLLR